MKSVLDFLNSLPVGLWTALNGIIAFVGAVLVVHLTNRANDKRLRRQLVNDQKNKLREHQRERSLKKRERDFVLRQEVYLDAVAAMQAGFEAITKLGDLDMPPQDVLTAFNEKSPALAKLQVVAGLSAITATFKLSAALSRAITKLVSERMPLDAERANNNFIGQHLKLRRAEITTLQDQFKGLNEMVPERERLINRIAFEQASVVDLERKYGKDLDSAFQKQLTLLQRCSSEAVAMWPLIAAAVVEVRRDLELPIDEQAFQNPVGHFKFPHLWPPKLPQAGRADYQLIAVF